MGRADDRNGFAIPRTGRGTQKVHTRLTPLNKKTDTVRVCATRAFVKFARRNVPVRHAPSFGGVPALDGVSRSLP
jgi:hypothetical protein